MRSVLASAALRNRLALFGFTGYTGMPTSPRKAISKPSFSFNDAGQFLGRSRNAEQKRFQLVQAVVAVGKASCSYTQAPLILHFHIMMGVGPVQSNIPHVQVLFLLVSRNSWEYWVLILTGLKATTLRIID